jgi:hypothetical protein
VQSAFQHSTASNGWLDVRGSLGSIPKYRVTKRKESEVIMKRVLTFLAVTTISTVCAVAQVGVIPKAPLYFTGMTAPDFTAANAKGKAVSLSDFGGYGGGFIVLDISAVWCGPSNFEAQQGYVSAATAAVADHYATQYLANAGTAANVGVSSSIVQVLLNGPTQGVSATPADVKAWIARYNLPFTVLYTPTTLSNWTVYDQSTLYSNTFDTYALQPPAGAFVPMKVVLGPDMKILGYPGSAGVATNDPNLSIQTEDEEITGIIQHAFNTNDSYKLYDLIAFTKNSGVPIGPANNTYESTIGAPLTSALKSLKDIQSSKDYTAQQTQTAAFCTSMGAFVSGVQSGPASSLLLSTPLAQETVLAKALDIQVDMGCAASPFPFQPVASVNGLL